MSSGLFVTIYFIISGLALFLGMLHTKKDQDTLEKVDQGNTFCVSPGFKSLMHTEQHYFFFYILNTPQFDPEC